MLHFYLKKIEIIPIHSSWNSLITFELTHILWETYSVTDDLTKARVLWWLRLRLFYGKSLSGKCFSENDLRENILWKKRREKREIKIRKMFSPFQIRKTFYRKMALFSVDQENIFSWPLIFRETNTRKCWKHFPESHFQWNKRTRNELFRTSL